MQKLQSASVGDCIHERAVTEASGKKTSAKAGHMSIRSLTSDNNGDLMPPNPTQAPLSPAQIKGYLDIAILLDIINEICTYVSSVVVVVRSLQPVVDPQQQLCARIALLLVRQL